MTVELNRLAALCGGQRRSLSAAVCSLPVAVRCSVHSLSLDAMPFSRLAQVEVQLILQCCNVNSWLQFARCNRTTLAAASESFATRFLPPLSFSFKHPWP